MKRHIVKKVKRCKSHRFYLPEAAKKKINQITNNEPSSNINKEDKNEDKKEINKNNQKEEKNDTDNMETNKKIEKIQDVLQEPQNSDKVKRVKRDKSLIERAESSKVILVDNDKMLLKD